MRRIVIIGGGIAGLATALRLRDRSAALPGGLELLVLEAGARVGGNIRTEYCEGFTIEQGPNGFLDNVPATTALIDRLGLTAELQRADSSASKRFLFRNGRMHPLPTGPLAFLTSPVLGPCGRLRVLVEPFARKAPEGIDETIHEFAKRRIGAEAAEVLIDAMVSGIFAGNSQELSLASAFPRMAVMEARHGSLARAMLALRSERRRSPEDRGPTGGPAGPGGTLTSFKRGLNVFVDRLASELQGTILRDHSVTAIERCDREAGWRIVTSSGATLDADAVVVAIPAAMAAPLLTGVNRTLGETVGHIPVAGLAVIALGYEAASIGGMPNGFGYLIPRREGLRTLGCLWDSSIFPGRAPNGNVLLRVMVGGAHDPQAVGLDEDSLLTIARRELAATMKLTAAPILTRIYRHPLGIAQYVRGHRDRLNVIEKRLSDLPGLWVAGSSFYGVSMNACAERAIHQTEDILKYLSTVSA